MKYIKNRKLIIEGSLYRVILAIALPLMISTLVQRAYTLTDMYFLGKLGSYEVAAITFVDPIINAILNMGMGLSVPMIATVSQSIGSKKYDNAKKSIGNLVYIALITSFVIGVFGLLFSTKILKLLNLQGKLLSLSAAYLKIVLMGTIFTFINTCYIAIKQAEGDSMRPLYMNLASLMLNILLNPIFIFHMNLGIVGAALATVISKCLLSIYGIWDTLNGSGLKVERKHITITRDEFKRMVALGLPAIITNMASPLGNMLINSQALSYGPALIASVGLGNKINSIIFSPNSSLCTAMTTITGQNLGNGTPERIREAFKKISMLIFFLGIIGVSVILYFSTEIVGSFSQDPKVISTTIEFLKVTLPTVFMWGIHQVVSGIYQGAGYTKISMYITLIRLWIIRIPLIFILNIFIGEKSLWYSTAIATNSIGIIAILFYFSNTWMKKNKYFAL
jgi:putative MATE family efflux protein